MTLFVCKVKPVLWRTGDHRGGTGVCRTLRKCCAGLWRPRYLQQRGPHRLGRGIGRLAGQDLARVAQDGKVEIRIPHVDVQEARLGRLDQVKSGPQPGAAARVGQNPAWRPAQAAKIQRQRSVPSMAALAASTSADVVGGILFPDFLDPGRGCTRSGAVLAVGGADPRTGTCSSQRRRSTARRGSPSSKKLSAICL